MRAALISISLASLVATSLLSSGCASTGPAFPSTASPELIAHLQALRSAEAEPVIIPPPEDTTEAQAYLSGALASMRSGQPRQAAAFLDAILKSDHLSDRGRANVYWLAADAHHLAGNDERYVDCLAGFLVAAEVLPQDGDMRKREVDARAALVARKLKTSPVLGKSPSEAIHVEDARDPSTIVAELVCGRTGRYVEDIVAKHGAADGDTSRQLEERRLRCSEGGSQLVLWFDVTHTRDETH